MTQKETSLPFDPLAIPEVFQNYFRILPTVQKKLLAEVNKFSVRYVEIYESIFNLSQNKFKFQQIESRTILKLLKNVEINKAAGIDNTYGKNDGTGMIIIPVTQIWNLYIKLSHFSKTCKLALIKSHFYT